MDQRADNRELLHRLGERVKELTALHDTARILQNDERPLQALMEDVALRLPGAWQYPEIAGARIFFRDLDVRSPGFRLTDWMQTAGFTTPSGDAGGVEVCYLEERPQSVEGPFLAEERSLINSVAEMLRSHFQETLATEALRRAYDDLEDQVRLRTQQLEEANRTLQLQIAEHTRVQERVERYQRQLRRLASELSLSEARQRRIIAGELHDHIGQALAFIRIRMRRLQGDAIFSGFEDSIADILQLVEQAINSTRSLTFQISPPVLYELGLQAAMEWLAEQLGSEHEVDVRVEADDSIDALPEDSRVVLFQAVRELIVNAIKHAGPSRIIVRAHVGPQAATVEVTDDGCGFDASRVSATEGDAATFGLFSIRERLDYLGGSMDVASRPGSGTSVTLTTPLRPTSEEERF